MNMVLLPLGARRLVCSRRLAVSISLHRFHPIYRLRLPDTQGTQQYGASDERASRHSVLMGYANS
jgi:hypothetical protein